MKKLTLLVAVLFVSVIGYNEANAQAGFQVGVKGGLNFANVTTEISTDGKTGFHAGAFAMLKLGKVAIQPELLFSTQGYSFTAADPTGIIGDIESDFNSSYINIPIIVKLYLVQGINLQVGPQLGFASKSEVETTIAGVTATEDIKDAIKGTDLSFAFGAGVDLPFGLNITARYNLGLSDIIDADDTTGDSDSVKNQVFQVSVGYALFKK